MAPLEDNRIFSGVYGFFQGTLSAPEWLAYFFGGFAVIMTVVNGFLLIGTDLHVDGTQGRGTVPVAPGAQPAGTVRHPASDR